MNWLWSTAYAQTTKGLPIIDDIKREIAQPIIYLLLAVAFVTFLYGVYEMIAGSDNEESRKLGQQHVLWGVIGLFIMVSVFGILNVVCQTVGCI